MVKTHLEQNNSRQATTAASRQLCHQHDHVDTLCHFDHANDCNASWKVCSTKHWTMQIYTVLNQLGLIWGLSIISSIFPHVNPYITQEASISLVDHQRRNKQFKKCYLPTISHNQVFCQAVWLVQSKHVKTTNALDPKKIQMVVWSNWPLLLRHSMLSAPRLGDVLCFTILKGWHVLACSKTKNSCHER